MSSRWLSLFVIVLLATPAWAADPRPTVLVSEDESTASPQDETSAGSQDGSTVSYPPLEVMAAPPPPD